MSDQADLLYWAEAFLKRPPYLHRFPNWLAAAVWLDGVVASAWWKKQSPIKAVYLVPNGHDKKQWMTGAVVLVDGKRVGEVTHPRRLRMPRMDGLGHELAHIAEGHTEDTDDETAHGPEFCRRNLAFVRHFFGADAAGLLEERMARRGVEW